LEAFWFPGRRNGNGAGGAITGSAVVLLICSSYWLSLEVVFLVRVQEDNSSVIVAVVVVDGACAGVVESTSDAFALALQIFVNRQLSSQMIKSILFRKKWLLHLLTTTAFLFLLFLSGTRSETLFFGHNFVSRNIPLALDLVAACQHPDARWLTEACAGKDVNTREDVKRVFSALGQNDARALCFAWLFGDQEDLTSLHRAAELGFAFAQAWMFGRTRLDEKFKLAQLAATQGERDGLFWLGWCFRDGEDGDEDLDMAKENFLLASELGYVNGMLWLGDLLDEFDPQRWRWWGQTAALGFSWDFLSHFVNQFELFDSGSRSAAAMFAIGRALQGHVNEEARTIFNREYEFDSLIGPAKQATAFYEAQIKATKDAMHAWTLVGIKLKVVKDVRKLIAKLIWDSRD
jgi:hypothetical protein